VRTIAEDVGGKTRSQTYLTLSEDKNGTNIKFYYRDSQKPTNLSFAAPEEKDVRTALTETNFVGLALFCEKIPDLVARVLKDHAMVRLYIGILQTALWRAREMHDFDTLRALFLVQRR
jgi:ssRNA-specific RNase YbeY (16S rRNA maturation enzyme)